MDSDSIDVAEVRKSFQHFTASDYSVFVLMLGVCSGIGLYFGCVKKQKSVQDYLMGGRDMGIVPVTFSLVASFISGISLLGTPTELYLYGTAYLFCLTGACLMSIVISFTFMPVLHDLQITSAYEERPDMSRTHLEPFIRDCYPYSLAATKHRYAEPDPIVYTKFHVINYVLKQHRVYWRLLNYYLWKWPVVEVNAFSFMLKYLELRYDKRLRLFGSIIFSFYLMAWLPIVIYVPALAFNQVTGVNIHIVTPIVCFVCIFYTSLGGLKAVVWTDVIQTIVMTGAMFLVIIKGTINVGGFGEVWQKNWNTGRIEMPSFRFDLTDRHSIWSVSIGSMFYWIGNVAVNQSMMQRFLSLPNLKSSKRAVWGFLGGIALIVLTCAFSGMVAYARYYNCDPLDSKLALAKDQILPLLVMDVLGEWNGLPGIFVAGVFSAALSSLSTGLNSMSAVVLEDFWKPFFRELTHSEAQILMRAVVVVIGSVCVGLVFIVEKLGSVLQLSMSLSSASMGPLTGVFLMGLFLPFMNSTSALSGGVVGLLTSWWLAAQAQLAQANGSLRFDEKPRFVLNCTYTFPEKIIPNVVDYEVPYLYRISYFWYTAFGCIVTIVVACLINLWPQKEKEKHFNELRLYAPVLRKWIARKYQIKMNGADVELNKR